MRNMRNEDRVSLLVLLITVLLANAVAFYYLMN
jgi:hypothetical protein